MDFTNDFFIQAQGCIERVFRSSRQELLEASGNIAAEFKDDNTAVTELDRKVEDILRKELTDFDGSIGFEGEESGSQGSRKTFWLVDPIDGTDSFVRGLPTFRNMATLIDDGQPIFTVVFKPVTDEIYVAAKGEGAFRNGVRIKVSDRPMERARLEIHSPGSNHDVWAVIEKLARQINAVRISGDFISVAEGKMDGLLVYKNAGGSSWDFAPRSLLISEAGGVVRNLGSDSYDYRRNDMLAANPVIFGQVMKIVT